MKKTKNQVKSEFDGHLLKLAKGAGIDLVGMMIGRGLAFLFALFLAWIIPPKALGIYFLAWSIFTAITIAPQLGLGSGLLRFVGMYWGSEEIEKVVATIQSAFIITIPISLLFAVLLYFSAEWISKLAAKPELSFAIKVISLSVPFYVVSSIAIASTQGLKLMRYKVYVKELIGNISKIFFALLLFFLFGLKLSGVLVATVLSLALTALAAIYFLNKLVPFFYRSKEIPNVFKQLIRFSFPQVFSGYLIFILLSMDILILGYFRSSSEVGIYSIAAKISGLITFTLASFSTIFSPIFSDLYYRKKIDDLDVLLKTVTRWTYTISLPIFLIFFIFARPILGVFGSAYIVGAASLMLLSAGQFVNAATGPIGDVLLMSGRAYLYLYLNIATMLVNLVLNFILVPTYGMVGAAIASAITLAGLNIARIFLVSFLMKIQPYDKAYLKAFFAALIGVSLISISSYFTGLNKITLIPTMTFFAFIYCGLIIKFGFDNEDMIIVNAVKARLFNK